MNFWMNMSRTCQFCCIPPFLRLGSKDASQAESEEKRVEIVSETMVTLGRLENSDFFQLCKFFRIMASDMAQGILN